MSKIITASQPQDNHNEYQKTIIKFLESLGYVRKGGLANLVLVDDDPREYWWNPELRMMALVLKSSDEGSAHLRLFDPISSANVSRHIFEDVMLDILPEIYEHMYSKILEEEIENADE